MASDTDSDDNTPAETPTEREGREGDGQEYVDRSKIDFDPDDGLYTGTAVEGTSDIPGSTSEDHGDDAPVHSPEGEDGGNAGAETGAERADPEPA
jgi:hypothetical protein